MNACILFRISMPLDRCRWSERWVRVWPVSGGAVQPDPVDNQSPRPPVSPPKKSGLPWWGILLIIAVLAVPACGIFAALGIYGVRKYMVNAKQAEAKQALPAFAQGIVACAKSQGVLPKTSTPVPPDLASISGGKYQSSASDWTNDPTLSCAGFGMSGPQYFQYQWVLEEANRGKVRAAADLDGDGAVDTLLTLGVECQAAGACASEPQPKVVSGH